MTAFAGDRRRELGRAEIKLFLKVSLSLQVHELLRKSLHKMLVKQDDGIHRSRSAECKGAGHKVDWQSSLWVKMGRRTSFQGMPRSGKVPIAQGAAYAKR